jgi:hypothetical protein
MKRSIITLLASLLLTVSGCGDSNNPGSDGGGKDGGGADAAIKRLTLAELTHACIRASACDLKTYPSLTTCLNTYYDLYRSLGLGSIYDQLYRCVNEAGGDCAAMAKCHGLGGSCDNTYQAQCRGTVAVSCDLIEGRVYELDCGLAGLTCQIKSGQTANADCSPGTCDSSYTDKCDDTREMVCAAGVIEMRECDEFGMDCGEGGGRWGTTGCRGETGDMCFAFGKNKFVSKCESTTALTCEGARVHKDDCTQHLLRNTACAAGSCVPAGTQCTTSLNRCAGEKLESCMDGIWQQFDCTTLGLGPCKASSTYGANCSRPSSL